MKSPLISISTRTWVKTNNNDQFPLGELPFHISDNTAGLANVFCQFTTSLNLDILFRYHTHSFHHYHLYVYWEEHWFEKGVLSTTYNWTVISCRCKHDSHLPFKKWFFESHFSCWKILVCKLLESYVISRLSDEFIFFPFLFLRCAPLKTWYDAISRSVCFSCRSAVQEGRIFAPKHLRPYTTLTRRALCRYLGLLVKWAGTSSLHRSCKKHLRYDHICAPFTQRKVSLLRR